MHFGTPVVPEEYITNSGWSNGSRSKTGRAPGVPKPDQGSTVGGAAAPSADSAASRSASRAATSAPRVSPAWNGTTSTVRTEGSAASTPATGAEESMDLPA